MSPLPIVPATLVPNTNAATKLKNAAHITACVGDSTRVDTMVAIEFAASWKPLRKSKTSATKMMKKIRPRNAPAGAAGAVAGAVEAAARREQIIGEFQVSNSRLQISDLESRM